MKSIDKLRRIWLAVWLLWLTKFHAVNACDEHDQHSDNHPNIELDDYDHRHRHLDESVDGEYCAFQLPSESIMIVDQQRMEVWKLRERANSIFFDRAARRYTIPVYFHVIQTSSTTGQVSDTRIRDFMDYLNDSFTNSNVPFDFEYKGVTRTIRSDWGDCYDGDTRVEYTRALRRGGGDTLNIYICNRMFTPKGASVTGFATGPTSANAIDDGVTINNDTGEARLNTLVHESGHWLGLIHTFGDNTCSASSKGDQVADTPQHISYASTVNCNSDPSTWDTCPSLPGLDPNDNYMNYSNDLKCRTRFTQGQAERMIAQYELYRMVPTPAPVPKPAPVPVPRPAPIPVPKPAPIPVPKPAPIPVPEPAPIPVPKPAPIPVPRPVAQPVPIPLPRPIPIPAPVPVNSGATCALLLSRCTTQKPCCGRRTCRSEKGILGSVFGGRCFFF